LELALNIAWLILSAGLVAASLLASANPVCSAKRHRIVVAVALACLVAFLFPVVSITDDLNSGAILAEGAKSKRWMPSTELVAFVATGLLAAFYALRSTWRDGSILAQTPLMPQDVFGCQSSRRPPPAIY
jgi:hypothetical protein